MNPRLLPLAALFAFTLPAAAEVPVQKESAKLDDLKPLIATVGKADKVILYEGLPHPLFERALVEAEKKDKKTVTIAGWPFYAEPLALKNGDAGKLTDLVGSEKTYAQFGGEKKCGGFHPDYAVEWRVGKDTYYALVCFGCGEVKVYGPTGGGVRTDFGARGDELGKLLKPYRKNRPASKD